MRTHLCLQQWAAWLGVASACPEHLPAQSICLSSSINRHGLQLQARLADTRRLARPLAAAALANATARAMHLDAAR